METPSEGRLPGACSESKWGGAQVAVGEGQESQEDPRERDLPRESAAER